MARKRSFRFYAGYETAESVGATGTFQLIELLEVFPDDRETEVTSEFGGAKLQGIHFEDADHVRRYLVKELGEDAVGDVEEGS